MATEVPDAAITEMIFKPYKHLQAWVNGNVIVNLGDADDYVEGTLLTVDYDGVIVQSEITVASGATRMADVFVPWNRVSTFSFTAVVVEQAVSLAETTVTKSTLPEYTPGKDNWAGNQ